MKIFYLFIVIMCCYMRYTTSIFFKLLSLFFCFFYLFEYLFIFIFCNLNVYYIFLFRYWKKESYSVHKKLERLVISDYGNYYKKKEQKNIKVNKLLKLYYNRRMHFGITIVYIQILLRKIKEKRNYFIYIFFYGLKRKYNNLKKKIMNNSLHYFFFFNYGLIFFLEYMKKNIWLFMMFLQFIKLYIKIKMKILIIKLMKLKKVKKEW